VNAAVMPLEQSIVSLEKAETRGNV
jgi:hypothetical protein